MKRMIFLLSSVALLFACNSGTSAVEYNDKIIKEQGKITKLFLEIGDYIATDVEKANSIRELATAQCDSSIAVIQKMPDFEGDVNFRNAALDLFKFYRGISSNEYKEMIEILQDEDIDVDDIERISALQEEIGSKETKFDNKMAAAQNEFAKKNNIQIAPNSLQKTIDDI